MAVIGIMLFVIIALIVITKVKDSDYSDDKGKRLGEGRQIADHDTKRNHCFDQQLAIDFDSTIDS